MNGLMLHCGSQLKSREEVFTVPVPPATATYVPLSYESFVTRIEKQLAVENIAIKDQKLALVKNGQRLFGLMELQLPESPERDFGCVLGIRNSYDKSCSIGLCIGARVVVCDNLSFSGSQITFERKHTANLLRDLMWVISETMAGLAAQFTAQADTFEAYRRTEITDKQAHDLAIRFLDKRAMNVTDIPGLLREWREPRHAEFAKAGRTAWRLFNAATETIKGDLWRLPARTGKIHAVLDEECGINRSRGEEIEVAQ